MMKAITKAMDRPFTISPQVRGALVIASGGVAIVIFVVGLVQAMNHTARIGAADGKPLIQALVDKTTTFGRVVVDQNGIIQTWNHGMTTLTGWTSKEMVSGTAARLDPGSVQDPMTFTRVWSRRPTPWIARGTLQLKTKDGQLITAVATIRDLGGEPLRRELTFDTMTPEPME